MTWFCILHASYDLAPIVHASYDPAATVHASHVLSYDMSSLLFYASYVLACIVHASCVLASLKRSLTAICGVPLHAEVSAVIGLLPAKLNTTKL